MPAKKKLVEQNKKDFELSVALSYKVKNGSVKVSEKDLRKLGVGIVEEVVVRQVGEKEGLSVMLFSDSHIKSGNVIMSVADARGIEVEEGDKVIVKKLSSLKSPKRAKSEQKSEAQQAQPNSSVIENNQNPKMEVQGKKT